jgi:membrane protein
LSRSGRVPIDRAAHRTRGTRGRVARCPFETARQEAPFRGSTGPDMPNESKPNALTVAALAAGGLLLSAFGRGDGSAAARQPATTPRPADGSAAPRRSRDHAAAPDAGERGRHADTPSQIPARGWWDILKRTFSEVSEDRILTEAAGITFYALLALFPAIAAMVSIYGLFADPAAIAEHLDVLGTVVPGGGMQIIEEQVKRITSKGDATLGFGAIIGLLTALWSSNQAMKALVDALNVVYGEHEERSFLYRTVLTLSFTVAGILFILLAMGSVVVLPIVLNFVGLGDTAETLLSLARWPVMLVVVGLFLAAIYRFGPDRDTPKWRWVTWGSTVAAFGWLAVSGGFSYYVTNFGNYNETYGSLGAVIGFMTWIWISSSVVLVGAELDAEMEHQTARDTTEGPEQPLGTRGAKMADEVAA